MLRSFQGQAWCLQHYRWHSRASLPVLAPGFSAFLHTVLDGRVHTAHLNSLVTEGFAKSGVRIQATTTMARIIAIWLQKAWHCYMSSWRCYSSKCLQEPWESRLQADKVVKSRLYNTLQIFTKLQMSLWVKSLSAFHVLQHPLWELRNNFFSCSPGEARTAASTQRAALAEQ